MPKTKIVFLCRRAWPEVGGVENHVREISAQLQKTHEITIITEQSLPELKRDEVFEGVRYLRIPVKKATGTKKELWSWLKEHFSLLADADNIHVHDVFFWLYPFLHRLVRTPIFTTFHGYEGDEPTWKQKLWHQVADLFSDNTICIGGFHQKWYEVDSGVVSYGGVDQVLAPLHRAPQKLPRKMVFVGRLAKDTGIMQYLNALALMPVQHRPHIDVFGDGPLRKNIAVKIETEHLPVTLKGVKLWNVTDYQKYDLALVSGYLTILSALAAHVPVLSTYQTDLKKDYLKKTPFAQWIRIATSVEDLAMKLGEKVNANSPESLKWVAQQTWENIAEMYSRMWHEKN